MGGEGQSTIRFVIRRRASIWRARSRWTERLLDARVVGAVAGILAALGLMGATLTFVVDLFVAPWQIYTTDVEESLHLLASVVGLAGATQLSRYRLRGVVLASLGLNVAATVVFSRSRLGQFETVVPMLTWFLLAAWTIAARPPRVAGDR